MPYAPPGGSQLEDVNPDRWTDQMLKAWKVATYHKGLNYAPRPIVSLDDVDKKATNGELVNSPRSLQACLYLGIDPQELVHRPLDCFLERGLSRELQELKFQYYENQRQDKLERLREERQKIIQEKSDGAVVVGKDGRVKGTVQQGATRDVKQEALEKEQARIEICRRRQEKELAQTAKLEAMKQQMAAENAARLEAEKQKQAQWRAEKCAKEKAWQAGIREKELQRKKEEDELEKKSKQMAQERYLKEQADIAAAAKAAKVAKKEALLREIERASKQEEFRKQLEKIQESFQEAARERGREIARRDEERQKALAIIRKEKAEENAVARKAQEERHDNALKQWYFMLQKRVDDYNKRQAEQKLRMVEKLRTWKVKMAEQKEALEAKEKARLDTIAHAAHLRAKRAQDLIDKAEEQNRILRAYLKQKALDEARKNVENQLREGVKHMRCEALKRIQALHRRQILEKIEKETEKVRQLLEGRQKMLEAHLQANMNLSLHRQSMSAQVESLKISKKWRESLSPSDRAELDAMMIATKGK